MGKKRNIHKILIIKMRYIGDTVLITPLVNALKNGMPHARIDVVVNHDTQPVLLDHPFIENIWGFDHNASKKNMRYTLKFVKNLWKQHYDMVIDLTNNDRSALITFISGAPIRIGYVEEPILRQKILFTTVINSVLGTIHTVDHHLKAAESLGLPVVDRHPYIFVSKERIKKTEEKLADRGLNNNEPFIIIHPGARRWYKSWPIERFSKLAHKIIRTFGIRVVLSGSKEDCITCREILEHCREELIDLSGRVPLSDLPALISKSICLIGNDSAPIHIATAVKTPTIALFGPTDWKCWYPRRKHDKVIAVEFSCRPCGHGKTDCPLGNDYCMDQISLEKVWLAVENTLKTGPMRNRTASI